MHKSKCWYAAALVFIATASLSVRSWVAADDDDKTTKSQPTATTTPDEYQSIEDPFAEGLPKNGKPAKQARDPNSPALPMFKIDLKAKIDDGSNDKAAEQKIKAALDTRGDYDFNELPLKDVAEHFQKRAGVPIELSDKSLSDAAIASDVPISFVAKNITLRSAMRLTLRPMQLNYIVRDGVLLVTTQADADEYQVVHVYPVADILIPWGETELLADDQLDYDSLIELITTTVAPTTWDTVGGPGGISPINGTLSISQTQEIHEQIEGMLAALRKVSQSQKKTLGGDSVSAVEHAAHDEAATRIAQILQQPVRLSFSETALHDAIELMSKQSGMNIVLDQKAIADAAVATDTPVTRSIKDLSFGNALKVLVEPLLLTWIIRDEVLLITTQAEADLRLEIRVYPVGDLIHKYRAGLQPWQPLFDFNGFSTPPARTGQNFSNGESYDFDTLIEAITTTIAPTTWDTAGGPGAVGPCESSLSLAISRTGPIHRQIEQLLTDIRAKQKLTVPKTAQQMKQDDEKYELKVYFIPTEPVESKLINKRKQSEVNGKNKCESITFTHSDSSRYQRYESVALSADNAAKLLRELVDPPSWNAEEVFIRAVDDRLVIRQQVSVHRKIDKMLGELGVPSYPRLPRINQVIHNLTNGNLGGGSSRAFGGAGGS